MRKQSGCHLRILRERRQGRGGGSHQQARAARFFARHSVGTLLQQSDYELEQHGRLTDSLVYDQASDKYLPISWDGAFDLIARHLNALPDPDQAAPSRPC